MRSEMHAVISRIRAKPEEERRHILNVSMFVLGSILFFFWLAAFSSSLDSLARSQPVSNAPSPLQGIQGSLQSFGGEWSKLKNEAVASIALVATSTPMVATSTGTDSSSGIASTSPNVETPGILFGKAMMTTASNTPNREVQSITEPRTEPNYQTVTSYY